MRAPIRSKSPPATWRRARRRPWTNRSGWNGRGILFSLSHVALPFPQSDPVYGNLATESPGGPVALGLLSPRGERAVLTVPVDVLMRVTSNPFFPYLAQRLSAWVNAGR